MSGRYDAEFIVKEKCKAETSCDVEFTTAASGECASWGVERPLLIYYPSKPAQTYNIDFQSAGASPMQ